MVLANIKPIIPLYAVLYFIIGSSIFFISYLLKDPNIP